jgi:hypothetical protein
VYDLIFVPLFFGCRQDVMEEEKFEDLKDYSFFLDFIL